MWYKMWIVALRVLLTVLGALLAIASRLSGGMRAAITRDVVMAIETNDGIAHRFVFKDRVMTSASGAEPKADCTLRFATQSQAIATLTSRRATSLLYAGLLDGSITIAGNPFISMWFYDLTQWVIPLAERPRWTTPPSAYTTPNTAAAWASRITREPVADELDPAWQDAARERRKLKMMRVAAGEPTLEF